MKGRVDKRKEPLQREKFIAEFCRTGCKLKTADNDCSADACPFDEFLLTDDVRVWGGGVIELLKQFSGMIPFKAPPPEGYNPCCGEVVTAMLINTIDSLRVLTGDDPPRATVPPTSEMLN